MNVFVCDAALAVLQVARDRGKVTSIITSFMFTILLSTRVSANQPVRFRYRDQSAS